MRDLIRALYVLARGLNDAAAIASGNPARIARRAYNRAAGRAIGRSGIFR